MVMTLLLWLDTELSGGFTLEYSLVVPDSWASLLRYLTRHEHVYQEDAKLYSPMTIFSTMTDGSTIQI